jgi:hypothetical protein
MSIQRRGLNFQKQRYADDTEIFPEKEITVQ